MKRIYLFLTAALALMLAPSCEQMEQEGLPVAGTKEIKLSADLGAYTKATDTEFENGDAIGLNIIVDQVYLENAKFTMTGGGLTPDRTYYWYDDNSLKSTVFAYYPYSAEFKYSNSDMVFTVNADQSTHKLYTQSDFMLAKISGVTPTEETVRLPFVHMLSKVVVRIEDNLGEEITDVYFSDVYGSTSINPVSLKQSPTGSKGTIRAAKAYDEKGDVVWTLILAPQAEVLPELIVTTASQKQMTFTLSKPVTFSAGCQSSAAIVLDSETLQTEFTPEISDWLPDNDLNFGQNGGDEPVDPDASIWGVVGTITDWGMKPDIPMYADEKFKMFRTDTLYFSEADAFKIRANNEWNDEANYGIDSNLASDTFVNVAVPVFTGGNSGDIYPGAGLFTIWFDLENLFVYILEEGVTPDMAGSLTPVDPPVVDHTWGLIGSFNGWAEDYPTVVEDGYAVAKGVKLEAGAEFKFRADGEWNICYGTGLTHKIGVPAQGYSSADNCAVADAGVYDIYFDLETFEITVVLSESGEVYSLDGKQWVFTWNAMYGVPAVFDLGVTEPGVFVLAVNDGSGWSAYITAEYEINPKDATSGVITLTADGDVLNVPYSELTENSVYVAAADFLYEDVKCTLSDEFITIGVSEGPQGVIPNGEYWLINNGKVMSPLAEDAVSGVLPAQDLINGASTKKNIFTFTYDPDRSYYTIQDSYGRYLGQTDVTGNFTVSEVLPTDDTRDGYYWILESDYGETGEAFDIYNVSYYFDVTYSSSDNNWVLVDGGWEYEETLPMLVPAKNPVEEPKPYLFVDMDEVHFSVEGGMYEFKVKANSDWKVRHYADWLAITPDSGSVSDLDPDPDPTWIVRVAVTPNDSYYDRSDTLRFDNGYSTAYVAIVQDGVEMPAGPVEATIAEFLAASESSDVWYRLTGTIISIDSATYGDITIKDETGEVYVYGLTATKVSSNDNSFSTLGLGVNDVVTLIGTRASYSGSPQVGGPAYYVSHVDNPDPTGPELPAGVESIAVDFSKVTGSVQYAEEFHTFGALTLNIVACHINSQLRIYSSSSNNGVVVSNALPGNIHSIEMNAGYKADNLIVYGSNDGGATWNEVQKVAVATAYKDYTVSFDGLNYNMFKLDVEGANQVRISKMTVNYYGATK